MPSVRIPPHRLPLLVTGITGVAGYNALEYFQERYPGQVVGIRPHQTFRFKGEGVYAMDASDRDGLIELFAAHQFKSVLNCAGNCALKACELNEPMARRLNVESAEAITHCASHHGARMVHLSSDLVFSGKGHGEYVETDQPDPVTVYGKTMAEGEIVVRDRVPGAVVLRISLPMGKSFNRHAGAIDWIESRFRAGRPATLYFDEVRSCTYTDDLNHVFEHFLAADADGIFHLGGPQPRSLYQIAQIVNRVGGFDPNLLHGCLRHEAGPIPPRAGNVSMNSGRTRRGSRPSTLSRLAVGWRTRAPPRMIGISRVPATRSIPAGRSSESFTNATPAFTQPILMRNRRLLWCQQRREPGWISRSTNRRRASNDNKLTVLTTMSQFGNEWASRKSVHAKVTNRTA
ncbi:MAG: sugar nucleotide-binding protein [Planctomycetota bacterium]